jgi:hypothetical protein
VAAGGHGPPFLIVGATLVVALRVGTRPAPYTESLWSVPPRPSFYAVFPTVRKISMASTMSAGIGDENSTYFWFLGCKNPSTAA